MVIGILIALQINNWNEKRKQNLKEKEIVIALYDELKLNKDYIEMNQPSEEKSRIIFFLLEKRRSSPPAIRKLVKKSDFLLKR